MALEERLLHRAERAVLLGEPLDGGDLTVLGRDREHQAGAHRPPVDQHRAGTADAVLAADVGAGEAEVVAQRVGEQPPTRHPHGVRGAVDGQHDVVPLLAHALPPPALIEPRGRSGRAPAGRGSRRWRGCRPPARAAPARRRRAGRRVRRRGPPRSGRRPPRGSRPRRSRRRRARRRRPARSRRAGGRSRRRPRRRPRRGPGRTPRPRSRRGARSTRAGRRRALRRGWCAARPAPRPRAEPPSRASTTGISAAASACTSEPTVVPRLRMVACATCESAIETSGCTRRTSGEASTSACRASAPIVTPASSAVMASRPGSPLMSTSIDGCGQPHRQQRDQALAAGQHLGPRIAGQGRHRFGERPRPAIRERRWFHSAFVTSLAPLSVLPRLPRFTRW